MRFNTIARALLFGTWTLAACAQSPPIPETASGRALQAWLEAFNAADKVRLEAYAARYQKGPTGTVEDTLAFRSRTGGFQLLAVVPGEGGQIAFQLREVASPTIAIGKIEMTEKDPPAVARFLLRAVPPGVGAEAMLLSPDAATRNEVIEGAIARMKEDYIDAEAGERAETVLRERQKAGAYDKADGDSFAALLTKDLREVTRDKHLSVQFSPMKLPTPWPPAPQASDREQRRTQMRRQNCAFVKVERLPSNIGYLKFNAFMDPLICGPTAAAAMGFLAHVDALIIDLRENGGGDPAMVALLSTYLFPGATHLNDLYNRKKNETSQFWTLPYVPGERLPDTPVYVLTANRTFSGAEEFSYNLKALHRATIVGEVTGGGAHPTGGHRIGDHFEMLVPFARAVNPLTKANWEGTGVEPDVKVKASEALETALQLAGDEIRKKVRQGK